MGTFIREGSRLTTSSSIQSIVVFFKRKDPRQLKSAMKKATIFCAMVLMISVATAPTGATEDDERAIEAIERDEENIIDSMENRELEERSYFPKICPLGICPNSPCRRFCTEHRLVQLAKLPICKKICLYKRLRLYD